MAAGRLSWWTGAAVRRRTRDRKMAGSTPGRAISSQLGQLSLPSLRGIANRVPACMAGVRRGAFTCSGGR